MKAIRNINNNVAICEDSAGHEVIVFAKGIGFRKPPYEVSIEEIQRTFYDVDPRYIEVIQNADEEIVNIAVDIKEYANRKNLITSSNLVYSLIDHITYSIERIKKGIVFDLPIANDIRYMFTDEMEVGEYGIRLLYNRLGIVFPKEEAAYIALNVINSETEVANRQKRDNMMVNEITNIISKEMDVVIDKDTMNYSRFQTHMMYLLKKTSFSEDSRYQDLIQSIQIKYSREYNCAVKVKDFWKNRNTDRFLMMKSCS